MKDHYAEGIYFGMPEDEYHALPMLSASGIKNILISPTDFYYRSWLNHDRNEDMEDTQAMVIGRAYHKRILEGKEIFDRLYCPSFEAPSDCLVTIDDMKSALSDRGHSGKSTWKKADWILACRTYMPDVKILEIEKQIYDAQTNGRIQLSPELISRIELAAAMIEKHPQLSKCFSGGYAEVTVIWQDDGIWFKARFDYLKPRAISDLKTFSNMQNKPVDLALYGAMGNMKYHIQAAHYLNAGDKAIQFAKRSIASNNTGEGRFVFAYTSIGNGLVSYTAAPHLGDFCAKLANTEQHDFFFVFQQKGIAPLARGKKFERGSMYACGQASIEMSVRLFKKYYAIYGEDIWVDEQDITSFDDALFPPWSTEI